MSKKLSRTASYGQHHKDRRAALLYKLKDGAECEYCAQPLHKIPAKNFDGAPLELDHIEADTSKLGERLIHRRCNRTIIGNWQRHGPGWYAAHGIEKKPPVEGATATQWPDI